MTFMEICVVHNKIGFDDDDSHTRDTQDDYMANAVSRVLPGLVSCAFSAIPIRIFPPSIRRIFGSAFLHALRHELFCLFVSSRALLYLRNVY